ncbi:MAG: thermonuclease family protein [Caulobacterales bacterium]|nr:thermonuclease family protein [Caulobacterales bacterium]MCA0371678.1 thermonuclease family protein [Pseudomonadota bacterium]
MKLNRIFPIFLALCATPICAQNTINYKSLIVTHVYDGDSIRAKSGNKEIEIRLSSIDAPEFNQNFGKECRAQLYKKIYHARISINPIEQDKYGRTIAEIFIGNRNINREQVQSGCAWAYRQYLHDPKMIALEQEARRKKIGLWAQKSFYIMPPWVERRLKN